MKNSWVIRGNSCSNRFKIRKVHKGMQSLAAVLRIMNRLILNFSNGIFLSFYAGRSPRAPSAAPLWVAKYLLIAR